MIFAFHRLFLLILFSGAGMISISQNLVRNCLLEEISSCPTDHGQISKCDHWSSPGNGTTDYVHSCNAGSFSVPNNQWGNQEARSGHGYLHLILYYSSQGSYREYAQTRLACTLQEGKTYEVSFYVSCADDSRFAIDGIGAHFSETPLVQYNTGLIMIEGNPHIRREPGQVVDQKDEWVKIHGTYTASGGEQYITIGNYMSNNEISISTFPIYDANLASYYLEDISVESTDPIFSLGPDTVICRGDSITYNISDVCSNASLKWENGSTAKVRTISEPGWYTLSGEIGCSDFYDQVNISFPPDPGAFLPPDTVLCQNTTFEIAPDDTFESYRWQDGSPDTSYLASMSGVYWLEVEDSFGCPYRDSLVLVDMSTPDFFLGQDTLICLGQEVILNPMIDSAFHNFFWNDASSGTQLQVSDSGEYWLRVTNPCGQFSDTINIYTYNCNPAIEAPNAFTPNQDGLNDVFLLKAENISNFRLLVFDRWGAMVYEGRGLENGWDGNINGQPAPEGSYVWLAIYDILQGDAGTETRKAKGALVLLR